MCEGMIFFMYDCSCISNPTGTNKPNFSCLLCKIVGKVINLFLVAFFQTFLCLTLEFFLCSVYYIYCLFN